MAKIVTLKDKDDVTLYPQITIDSLGEQVDDVPTSDSDNLVKSGGVADALDGLAMKVNTNTAKIGVDALITSAEVTGTVGSNTQLITNTSLSVPIESGITYVISFTGWESYFTGWRLYLNGVASRFVYLSRIELTADSRISSIGITSSLWKDDISAEEVSLDVDLEVVVKGIQTEVQDLLNETQELTDNVSSLNKDTAKLSSHFTDSINLFNKASSLIKEGYYGGTTFHEADNYFVTHPIWCEGGVTYKMPFGNSMGSNTTCVLCNESGVVSSSDNVVVDANEMATYTPEVGTYVIFNIGKTPLNSYMVCKASEYPENYVQYGAVMEETVGLSERMINEVENLVSGSAIYGKKFLWTGDSICAANELAAIGVDDGGWARRIEDKYGIISVNRAVGGSVITENLYSGASLIRSILTKFNQDHAQLPDADYCIFDIGTNDADRIGNIVELVNGEYVKKDESQFPSTFGSIDMTDWSGDYNTDTFCGAFEKYIYQTLTTYPGIKLGYIVAMKMYHPSDAIRYYNRRAYFDHAVQICKKWGVPVLDLWNTTWMNPNIASLYNSEKTATENQAEGYFYLDGQHPTSTGYDYLTNIISSWIMTL